MYRHPTFGKTNVYGKPEKGPSGFFGLFSLITLGLCGVDLWLLWNAEKIKHTRDLWCCINLNLLQNCPLQKFLCVFHHVLWKNPVWWFVSNDPRVQVSECQGTNTQHTQRKTPTINPINATGTRNKCCLGSFHLLSKVLLIFLECD